MNNPLVLLPNNGTTNKNVAETFSRTYREDYDFPATLVGTAANISIYYDPSLGQQGLTLAQQMLNCVAGPYINMAAYFGITGGEVTIVISPRSGLNDGSGGAYHYTGGFGSGSVLYLDATFANTIVNPLYLEVGLYVAELSEVFMDVQNLGWGEGSSNGEALSRFLSERETPPGTMVNFVTAPSWAAAGFPDFISITEPTDQDSISIGCGMIYLYWMCLSGFTVPQIVQAGGATLADNYQTLTGQSNAYANLMSVLTSIPGLNITSDNPFQPISPSSPHWNVDDLTQQTDAPLAVSSPAAYMFNAQTDFGTQVQSTQQVVYRDDTNTIQLLVWFGSWSYANVTGTTITQPTSPPLAFGDPSGWADSIMNVQYIVYRDQSNHIQLLFWNEVNYWTHVDLTQMLNAPLAAGNPVGYVFNAQGTQHIIYRDINGHIQEIWSDGTWNIDDITLQTSAPIANGDPCCYMFDTQGTQHVIYVDDSQHVQELWWDGSWNNDDITDQTGAPLAAGDPVGYAFEFQGTQHVIYRDVNGNIQEFWWDGSWNNDNITLQTAAPAAAFGIRPVAYVDEVQGTQVAIYRDINGHFQELWWNGSWNCTDLTDETNPPQPSTPGDLAGYMFAPQDSKHLFYKDVSGHIQEVWQG